MFDSLLLSGIFISLLAGQFARIELINSTANVYVHEFLLLIFIVSAIVRTGFAPIRAVFKLKGVCIFIIILLFSFGISFGEFTFNQNSIAFLYFVRFVLYALFGGYFFAILKRKKNIQDFLHKLIYIFSIILLVVTAIQYVFFPNFWWSYAFGWDPHLFRASGVYLDVFIAAAIYGLLALFWFSKKKRILSLCFIMALVLSFSRSAYIAFAVSVIYSLLFQKKWKIAFIFIALFSALIILIPKPFGEGGNLLRTASINSRIQDYKLGFTLWEKKPLFGFGYNRIRYAKEQMQLISVDDKSHSLASFHSSFLIILVTTGIVGFISFAILVFSFFKKHPRLRVYLIFILTMSLFDNVLLHVLIILPLIFIAASVYSSFE